MTVGIENSKHFYFVNNPTLIYKLKPDSHLYCETNGKWKWCGYMDIKTYRKDLQRGVIKTIIKTDEVVKLPSKHK